MENNPSFHGKSPSDDEYILAMEELNEWCFFGWSIEGWQERTSRLQKIPE